MTLSRTVRVLLLAAVVSVIARPAQAADPWVVYEGGDGPGKGKHVVLISGDEEYRSEETLPQLAKILSKHYGFTMFLAGGGIKGGVSVGATDELGSAAVEDRFHVKNLHATILHQMGLDPNRLSYFYGGLDQKLVGVEGAEPIRQLIS